MKLFSVEIYTQLILYETGDEMLNESPLNRLPEYKRT
jgi:hypothetical protein